VPKVNVGAINRWPNVPQIQTARNRRDCPLLNGASR
jgi:hypothetical protein